MKVDIKTIITLGALLVPLVGFYYTTNMRLDSLRSVGYISSKASKTA